MIVSAQENAEDELLAMSLMEAKLKAGASIEVAVQQAVALYPQHAALLSGYAVQAAALGLGPLHSRAESIAESDSVTALVERAISRAQEQRRPSPAIRSLLARAQEIAGSAAKLAASLSVGQSLLVKLDRRLIKLQTIPAEFLDQLAAHLATSRAALEAYLSAPPVLAAAEYKSRRRPSAAAQQSFAASLEACVATGELSVEGALRWRQGDSRS